jgi:uncharacterized protein YjbI with pentapeptide repeats
MRNISAYIDFLKEDVETQSENQGLKIELNELDVKHIRDMYEQNPYSAEVAVNHRYWFCSVSGSYDKTSGPLDLLDLYEREWLSLFGKEHQRKKLRREEINLFLFAEGTNLSGAEIKYDINQCKFLSDVNLSDVDFSNHAIQKSIFYKCKMGSIDFSNVLIKDSEIIKCNMDGATLNGIKRDSIRIVGQNVIFKKTSMKNSDLSNCDLSYSTITSCNLSGSNLSNGNFCACDMKYSNLSNCDLTGCNLHYINFYRANLSGVKGLETCKIIGCMDFRGANLLGVSDEFFKIIFDLNSQNKLMTWKSKEKQWVKATPREFFKGCKLPERVQRKIERTSGMAGMFSN